MLKIAKNQLGELFSLISSRCDLFVPVNTAGQVNSGLYNEDAEVDLTVLKTVKSGKDVFFPQSETLYTVTRKDRKMKIEAAALKDRDFVVFGMKACDLRGLEVLDKVFLDQQPQDSFYAARRAHGTIVAMACSEPEETCFCKVFGIDCADPKADVAVWAVGDEYCWKALTTKGEKLTAAVSALFSETDETAVQTEMAKNDPKNAGKPDNIIEKMRTMAVDEANEFLQSVLRVVGICLCVAFNILAKIGQCYL